MQQILLYGDSLSWGIIPETRRRLTFDERWPGVMENALNADGRHVRVIEDCLNGRRTVWEDPFKPGRKGIDGLAQRIESHSPLALVILMLGTNDFQSMHPHNAWHSGQGIGVLINAIRQAPIEPGMPVPPILVVAPPAQEEAKGTIAPKFVGGERKCIGLAAASREVADMLGCHFFDAGTVATVSPVDGVHLDADQHGRLGTALAKLVAELLQEPLTAFLPG
ncbi:SGNH/GDSL hydrolase family protein [Accumulibacter sp.]|uniref:SGNH/GDSL hydrolase family protein n=1 Tax=Accumulibacter sp. TaxID=2053492 RepID=UPI0025D1F92C|nr:SGNH/GDSL hydrolase family protein [Accumulibacter sp.]MCP5230125.1 SGNH/GDSL hydrolase family protein [Accumulibacter sp.]